MSPWSLVAIVLCATILCLVGIWTMKKKANSKEAKRRELAEKPSTFCSADYSADDACGLCLDVMTDEDVAECPCGKVFHLSCAEPTGSCPYCGTLFSEFGIRKPRRVLCPRCGSAVDEGICSCGAVMPDRRGMFRCGCGEMLKISSSRCPKCGRTFERIVCEVDKRFIPKRD